jgi:hypothetical protein
MNASAPADRSQDWTSVKARLLPSTSERNRLITKERASSIVEARRVVASAHGQSMSGSEQRQSVSGVYEISSSERIRQQVSAIH